MIFWHEKSNVVGLSEKTSQFDLFALYQYYTKITKFVTSQGLSAERWFCTHEKSSSNRPVQIVTF